MVQVPADATDPSSDDWLVTQTRYRRLSIGSLVGGIAGFLLMRTVGPLPAAVGIYWVGIVGFFAIRRAAPMALFDEREQTLERQASYDALRVAGGVAVIVIPVSPVIGENG